MVRGAKKLVEKIITAGAIFIGPYSPTALGDYVAGPSHVLPTGGAGASLLPALTWNNSNAAPALSNTTNPH